LNSYSYAAIYDILSFLYSRDEFYAELARIKKSIPISDRERKQEQEDLVIEIGGVINIYNPEKEYK